jgi:hypothetical protein
VYYVQATVSHAARKQGARRQLFFLLVALVTARELASPEPAAELALEEPASRPV